MATTPTLVKINDWREYCRIVDERCTRQQALLFRGQADPSWRLASVWERFLFEKQQAGEARDARQVRDRKLEAFKEQCHAGGHSLPDSDVECWAVGRHLGLVTPLLDWTSSPYVAAFFAWLTRYEIDNPDLAFWGAVPQNWGQQAVAVWELRNVEHLTIEGEFEWITGVSADANRQRAQQGTFTMLDHPEYADLETYLGARDRGNHLTKYELSGQAFKAAFIDLARRSINYTTLFPDLTGAAKQANIDAVVKLFTAIDAYLSMASHSRTYPADGV